MKLLEFKKPTVKYIDYSIGEASTKKVPVFLNFEAYNPNMTGLKNTSVSYELYTDGKRFLKGKNIKLDLVPNGTTKIVVPAEIVYKELLKILGPTAKQLLLGKKTIPVVAKVEVFGKSSFFSIEFKTAVNVDVPVPDDVTSKVSEVKDIIKSKFFK